MEEYAATALRNMSDIDAESAALILSFPWVRDDELTEYEVDAIGALAEIFYWDFELVQDVMGFSWVRDGITLAELQSLVHVRDFTIRDREFAWHVVRSPFMEAPFLQRDEYALNALQLWSLDGPPPGVVTEGSGVEVRPDVHVDFHEGEDSYLLAEIARQSWFQDGLDDDEAALLHAINDSSDYPENTKALIEEHYVESSSVELPNSGVVGIAVVRHTPFPPGDSTLPTLEFGLRVMDDFMGAPLPVNDVIVLVQEPKFRTIERTGKHRRFCYGGGNVDPCYMTAIVLLLNRESGPPQDTILHELGHYYLNDGPNWLVEGMAQFLEAYAIFRYGARDLEERLSTLETSSGCAENIWEHVNPYREGICDYTLGERFMLGMYEALGPAAMSAALRELYVQSLIFEHPNHDSIFHAFNSNVPSGREEEFKSAWRRFHGSPVIDRVLEDSPDLPPLVALYNATGGENWVNDRNWDSAAPLGAWHGVFTNTEGQVTGVELAENALAGPIPSELGNLSSLIGLILRENDLTGEIPPELGNLTNLDELDLRLNRLTGEIPSELGNLTRLVTLDLGDNQLTGEIPAELGNLTNLRALMLQYNQLSGEIPAELASLTKLETLWLNGTHFTGCIADELPTIWVEKTGLLRCASEGEAGS